MTTLRFTTHRLVIAAFVATLALALPASLFAANTEGRAPKEKPFTVVIDAGHGGHDAGAKGLTAKEKDINLDVALKIGKLIESNHGDDVKVVYTRKTDRFVTLQGRCDIANNAKGDLFISVHVNSVDKKNPGFKTVNGASVYTLGLGRSKENLEVAKRENSVMMLEKNYTVTYSGFDPTSTESYIMFELNQNRHMDESIRFANMVQNQLVTTAGRANKGVRQDIFWVLVHTGMPAVLIELDFICNPTSEKFLSSETGSKQLSQAVSNAFDKYYKAKKKK